jgi:hypothetical protein
MPRPLAIALTLTDLLFITYWAISAAAVAGLIHLPATLMYEGYGQPNVTAWNWSFLPLDLAFSATGLAAVRAASRQNPLWRPLALISLLLTAVAGGMACAYWTLLGSFDPAWFLPNLLLLIWPALFISPLVRDLAAR